MKKLIAILAVMITFAGAVFAVTGEQLQINVTVNPVAPAFSIYGGKTSDEAAGTTYQGNATTPTAITFDSNSYDLTENDITVYIRLYQNNKAKYTGTATLTITATPLVNQTIQEGIHQTEAPTAADIQKTTPNGISYSINPVASTVEGNTVVTYKPNYSGSSVQKTDIGTFNLKWDHDPDLAVGSYQATITLGYDAP